MKLSVIKTYSVAVLLLVALIGETIASQNESKDEEIIRIDDDLNKALVPLLTRTQDADFKAAIEDAKTSGKPFATRIGKTELITKLAMHEQRFQEFENGDEGFRSSRLLNLNIEEISRFLVGKTKEEIEAQKK